jgi:hypothetical protein
VVACRRIEGMRNWTGYVVDAVEYGKARYMAESMSVDEETQSDIREVEVVYFGGCACQVMMMKSKNDQTARRRPSHFPLPTLADHQPEAFRVLPFRPTTGSCFEPIFIDMGIFYPCHKHIQSISSNLCPCLLIHPSDNNSRVSLYAHHAALYFFYELVEMKVTSVSTLSAVVRNTLYM